MSPPNNTTHPGANSEEATVLAQIEALLAVAGADAGENGLSADQHAGYSAGPDAPLGAGAALSLYGHVAAGRAAERRGRRTAGCRFGRCPLIRPCA